MIAFTSRTTPKKKISGWALLSLGGIAFRLHICTQWNYSWLVWNVLPEDQFLRRNQQTLRWGNEIRFQRFLQHLKHIPMVEITAIQKIIEHKCASSYNRKITVWHRSRACLVSSKRLTAICSDKNVSPPCVSQTAPVFATMTACRSRRNSWILISIQ